MDNYTSLFMMRILRLTPDEYYKPDFGHNKSRNRDKFFTALLRFCMLMYPHVFLLRINTTQQSASTVFMLLLYGEERTSPNCMHTHR